MRTRLHGPADLPTVLALPGAGSSGDLVARFLAPAARAAGLSVLGADYPRRAGSAQQLLADLDAVVRRRRPMLLAGVSLGAHLAVRWAAGLEPDDPARPRGLLLAAPAWTGGPGEVAALSAWSASRVAMLGLDAVLRETRQHLADAAVGDAAWVAEELLAAWPGYGQAALVRQLGVVAASAGPTDDELARLDLPAAVLGWPDDPWHPLVVAEHWADRLPHGVGTVIGLAEPAVDRAVVGHALLAALRRAGWPGHRQV